jgi:hypothetical protein
VTRRYSRKDSVLTSQSSSLYHTSGTSIHHNVTLMASYVELFDLSVLAWLKLLMNYLLNCRGSDSKFDKRCEQYPIQGRWWAGGPRTRRLLDLRAMHSVISDLSLDTIIHRVLPSQFATDGPDRPPTKGTVSARTRRVLHPLFACFLPTHHPCVHTT